RGTGCGRMSSLWRGLQVFIQDLVKNLFGEGNDVYREGEWTKSVELYAEALNVADYANSEDINISSNIIEKLYANRAAAYLNIGLYDQALADCDKALQLNEGNYRALYRKARSLKEMGRHKEAYDEVAKCSLAVPQDTSVIKLTQDLAKLLGLKIRKAYVRSKPTLNVLSGSGNSGISSDKVRTKSYFIFGLFPFSLCVTQVSTCTNKTGCSISVLCSVVQASVSENGTSETGPDCSLSSMETKATPLPPLSDGGEIRGSESYPVPESRLEYDAEIIGDELDDLIDSVIPVESPAVPVMKGTIPLPTSISSLNPIPATLVPPGHTNHPFALIPPVNLPPSFHQTGSSGYSGLSLDPFPCVLDSLDTLSVSDSQRSAGYGQHSFLPVSFSTIFILPGKAILNVMDTSKELDLAKNPLADTHEFCQACSVCFVKSGPGLLDYTLMSEEHKCKKDVLLGRLKHSSNLRWKRIRPRPTKNQYDGPYYICKDVAGGEECRYPGHCTFAYCQEEIDVWTLERKGFLSRDLLFSDNRRVSLSIPKILQEHQGIFMFLCGVCFDNKPRIISKTSKDNHLLCSHPVTKHTFEENKCLVHMVENTVRYTKIRRYDPTCQLDLCRHEARYGCVREDACFFAHSLIELKVWMMQYEQRIPHESIVEESKKCWNTEVISQGAQVYSAPTKFGPPNLKIRFVCGQCWRNGQVNEPDKNRKYCVAKARHPWSKDRRVVLVSSAERKTWTQIRPLPTKKPIPSQFEICLHVSSGKKCQYVGNCSFAHSPEERDLWTFMKDNNIVDLEQLYELWLQSQKPGCSKETSNSSTRENGKQIHMPTDYAEEVAGNHCWLCGKNCNSEKQWQQHITSEKHKDKVFNSEDDQNCWQYRFPTGTFKICERYLKGTCTEMESCKLAHGDEELKEWKDRTEFLLMKLSKARKDHLIAPNDNDFGKYSFLLKEIK
uniref:Zinc finger CCCH-type containing 7A n=1 Tax=Scleropages formosus TaxID=113540 RepID=A0A8C9TQ58_SCLFO